MTDDAPVFDDDEPFNDAGLDHFNDDSTVHESTGNPKVDEILAKSARSKKYKQKVARTKTFIPTKKKVVVDIDTDGNEVIEVQKEKRRGALSEQEQLFILKHHKEFTPEQIAEKLNRKEDSVVNFLKKAGVYQNPEHELAAEGAALFSLRKSKQWGSIKEQFTDHEIEFYEHMWVELLKQFRDDIMFTETVQIHQLIKFEILMNRSLAARKICQEQKNDIIQQMENLPSGEDCTPMEKAEKIKLREQFSALEANDKEATKEFGTLQQRHSDIMKSLKGTRDQRIDKATNANKNWVDVIKSLEDKDNQIVQEKYLGLMKEAQRLETERLSQIYDYGGGDVDRPILTDETVGDE